MTTTAMTTTSPKTSLPGEDPAERYYCIRCGAEPTKPCVTRNLYDYEAYGRRRTHEARNELMQRCLMNDRVQAAMFAIEWADRPAHRDTVGLPGR